VSLLACSPYALIWKRGEICILHFKSRSYLSYSVLEHKNRRFIFYKVEVTSEKKIKLQCNEVCTYSNTRP
jgi:hypothetical protein